MLLKRLLFKDLNLDNDLNLCGKVNNYENFVELQNDAEKIFKWSVENRMPLNLDKTVVTAFSERK